MQIYHAIQKKLLIKVYINVDKYWENVEEITLFLPDTPMMLLWRETLIMVGGWFVDKKFDIIQTDWCMMLKNYLQNRKNINN